MRTIGLDYDDTFNTNPEVWAAALAVLKQAGFRVVGVTFRNREQAIDCDHYHGVCDEIVYTAGKAKHDTVKALGIEIDIWIDDKPFWIVTGWQYTPDQPATAWVKHPGNLEPVRLLPFQSMPIHTNPEGPV